MVDYTTPVTATFEMQRQSIKQGQDALEQSIELQKQFGQAFVSGLESQQQAQQTLVETSHGAVTETFDFMEANVPGVEAVIGQLRTAVDDGYDELLEAHAEAYDEVFANVDESMDAYDEFSAEYLEALDEQLELVLDAHGQFETQSVEATEQVAEQVGELEQTVEDVQAQIEEVSEQAADAIEA
ncbi:hypothetical protein [Halovenus marina]|uniref:hypothetical protein n=1 Tax=Halovenus marina TaxID=3396621 RepID=UPI003F56FDC6